jgi:hypothetical protein
LLGLILNSTGNKIFAFSAPVIDLDARNYDYLQAEQNQKAVILSQIISSEHISSEENFSSFPGYLVSAYSFPKEFLLSSEKTSIFGFLDHRQLILQHIYPFHFFW